MNLNFSHACTIQSLLRGVFVSFPIQFKITHFKLNIHLKNVEYWEKVHFSSNLIQQVRHILDSLRIKSNRAFSVFILTITACNSQKSSVSKITEPYIRPINSNAKMSTFRKYTHLYTQYSVGAVSIELLHHCGGTWRQWHCGTAEGLRKAKLLW